MLPLLSDAGFGATGGFGSSAFGTANNTGGGLFGTTQNKPGNAESLNAQRINHFKILIELICFFFLNTSSFLLMDTLVFETYLRFMH